MGLSRKKLIGCLLVVALPTAGWIASEIRWAKINNPQGKFTSVSEYLVAGRPPSRVTSITTNGETFFIAFSPMDYWLAVPSGAAAYVFNDAGQLISWSRDCGDDGRFQKTWPLDRQERASLDDLKRIQSQGRANGKESSHP